MFEAIHLDLFSGIGGFSLAFEAAGFRTIGFCEFDADRQRDLRHHWPGVPIVSDIHDIEGICRVVADAENERHTSGASPGACSRHWNDGGKESDSEKFGAGGELQHATIGRRAPKLLLTAGVPCQPASAAGKRKGSADDRWLWPATLRVVERLRPDWCVFENPLGIASLAQPAAIPGVDIERLRDVPGRTLCEILTAIRLLGYDLPEDRDGVPWIPVVPAAGVGAFHGRDRLWIIARRGDVDYPTSRGSTRGNWTGEPECGFGQGCIGSREPVGDSCASGWGKRTEPQSGEIGSGDTTSIRAQPAKISVHTHLPNWSDAILERGQDGKWRAVKPGLRLLAHGVPRRTSKLRGFGNSITPAVAYEIAKAIREQIETNPTIR